MRPRTYWNILVGFAIASALFIAPVRFVVVNAVVNHAPMHPAHKSAKNSNQTYGVYDGVLMKMSDLSYAKLDDYTHHTLGEMADLSSEHRGPSGIYKQVTYVNTHDWHTTFAKANNIFFSDLRGWEIVSTANHEAQDGFYAVTYQKGNTIVIAFRGTNDVEDLVSDVGIYLNEPDLIDQLPSALQYVHDVRTSLPKGVQYHVIFTGHSMGAWLAQQMYLSDVGKYPSWDIVGATVFDSIGTHFQPNLTGINAVKDYHYQGDVFSYYGSSLGQEIDVKNPFPNQSIYDKHQMHDFYQYFYPEPVTSHSIPV